MIREHLFEKRLPTDPLFRWRGGSVSRLEGFSDGVFAVSLTLLIASSVPDTFHELWQTIRDFPAYLITFVFLYVCWQDHYIYFRRYGLEDGMTKVLNGAFLFLFVFFAFPLKFLGIFLWHTAIGMDVGPLFAIQPDLPPLPEWMTSVRHGQPWTMMAFYSSVCMGVYAVFSLMMVRAYRARERLELDEIEVHLTKVSLHHHLVMVIVCAISLGILIAFDSPSWAGLVFFVLGPAHAVLGIRGGMKTERLKQQFEARDGATEG